MAPTCWFVQCQISSDVLHGLPSCVPVHSYTVTPFELWPGRTLTTWVCQSTTKYRAGVTAAPELAVGTASANLSATGHDACLTAVGTLLLLVVCRCLDTCCQPSCPI